jgi:hypothetical protein
MNIEKQDELVAKYPQIFQDIWGDMRETCMAWGIAVGPGWYNIVDKLCADIMALDPGPDFKAAQVKEKFGGLRFYCDGWPEDKEKREQIGRLIGEAENESVKTCEECGTKEGVTLEGSWILALCPSCRGSRKKYDNDEAIAISKVYDERRKAKKEAKEKQPDLTT